jgi:carboxyl-terminal processing protease
MNNDRNKINNRKMNLKKINIILPLLLALFLVGGMLIGNQLNRISEPDTFTVYPRVNKISGVLDYISEEYVDSLNRDNLVESTIPEILKQLDPHSIYIPAKDLADYNEPLEGNFSGIGVLFNMQDDTVFIISTIPNGPSEKIGVLAGDRIIRVNDSLVAGVKMDSRDIVKMLKGKRGTRVMVAVARRGVEELIDFEITRDRIPIASIDLAYMLTDEIGFIKISTFSKSTKDEFLAAVDTLNEKGMKKLILDLRMNGGGYMNAATEIADQFLRSGKLIVYTEGYAQPRKDTYSTAKGTLLDHEVIVLIDEGSASASEILAGAIQDNDRGLILGRRSFGKGLVQQQTMFSDGSALRLTIARYYTPTGRSIQKPYENGMDDYIHEVYDRIERGEFIYADSIKFADSLRYTTPEGKTVYGGGGIMPDIFIPYDTTLFTRFYSKVSNRGLLYRFAYKYADSNRGRMTEFRDHHELVEYLHSQKLYEKFVEYAEEKGVKETTEEIILSRHVITTTMNAFIARFILDNKGYYPIIHEIDANVQKSLEIFTSS